MLCMYTLAGEAMPLATGFGNLLVIWIPHFHEEQRVAPFVFATCFAELLVRAVFVTGPRNGRNSGVPSKRREDMFISLQFL